MSVLNLLLSTRPASTRSQLVSFKGRLPSQLRHCRATRRKHAASAVPASDESNLRLAPRSPSPRLARLCLLAPHIVLCRVHQREVNGL
jgi:hypothetical protein